MKIIKCPVCNCPMKQSTFDYETAEDPETWYCSYMPCDCVCSYGASLAVWQELIRTRKALGIALDWLREVATPAKCDDDLCREFTKRKLAEIKTELEQKD